MEFGGIAIEPRGSSYWNVASLCDFIIRIASGWDEDAPAEQSMHRRRVATWFNWGPAGDFETAPEEEIAIGARTSRHDTRHDASGFSLKFFSR